MNIRTASPTMGSVMKTVNHLAGGYLNAYELWRRKAQLCPSVTSHYDLWKLVMADLVPRRQADLQLLATATRWFKVSDIRYESMLGVTEAKVMFSPELSAFTVEYAYAGPDTDEARAEWELNQWPPGYEDPFPELGGPIPLFSSEWAVGEWVRLNASESHQEMDLALFHAPSECYSSLRGIRSEIEAFEEEHMTKVSS